MYNIHTSIVGQMYKENKLYDFLMKYATNDEITEMHYYMDNDLIDQLDMLIEQIMQKIKT
jgi:hypothetical protein